MNETWFNIASNLKSVVEIVENMVCKLSDTNSKVKKSMSDAPQSMLSDIKKNTDKLRTYCEAIPKYRELIEKNLERI